MRNILIGTVMAATMGMTNAATLEEAVSSLHGQEVSLSGSIGYSWSSDKAFTFKSKGKSYDVVLDAGRTARKSLDNCKFTLFGSATEPCEAKAMAEIKVKGDTISLVIYELTLSTTGETK